MGCASEPPPEVVTPPRTSTPPPAVTPAEETAPPAPAAVIKPLELELTAEGVSVRGERAVALPPKSDLSKGFPAKAKQHGQDDMFLVKLGEHIAAIPAEDKKLASISVAGELPYRVLYEVLTTLNRSDVRVFEIKLAADPARKLGRVKLARKARLVEEGEQRLDLAVSLSDKGAALNARGGAARNCGEASIARAGKSHNIEAVVACAQRLRGGDPAFQREASMALSATPTTSVEEIIGVGGALSKLYAELELSLAK